jgi:hypothetical protein
LACCGRARFQDVDLLGQVAVPVEKRAATPAVRAMAETLISVLLVPRPVIEPDLAGGRSAAEAAREQALHEVEQTLLNIEQAIRRADRGRKAIPAEAVTAPGASSSVAGSGVRSTYRPSSSASALILAVSRAQVKRVSVMVRVKCLPTL